MIEDNGRHHSPANHCTGRVVSFSHVTNPRPPHSISSIEAANHSGPCGLTDTIVVDSCVCVVWYSVLTVGMKKWKGKDSEWYALWLKEGMEEEAAH